LLLCVFIALTLLVKYQEGKKYYPSNFQRFSYRRVGTTGIPHSAQKIAL